MIFERIRRIRTEFVRLGRIIFSWAKSRRILNRVYPKFPMGVYALFILLSPFAQIGTAEAPVMAAEDIAQIELRKDNEQLKGELRAFLNRYHSQLGEEYINAVVSVENKYQMKGFAKLATAVALNESYLGKVYPKGSHNIWGLGASTPQRWINYRSWKEGATDFYRVIKRLGMRKVTYENLLKVSRPYVGTSKWQHWGNKIWRFYQKI